MHILLTYSKIVISTILITITASNILLNKCDFDDSSKNFSIIILLLSLFILLSTNIKLCSALYNIRSRQKYDTTLPPLSIKQKILSTCFLLIFSFLPIISVLQVFTMLGPEAKMCSSSNTTNLPIEESLPATTDKEIKSQTDSIKKDNQIISPSKDQKTPPPPVFYEFTIKDGKIKQNPIGKTED